MWDLTYPDRRLRQLIDIQLVNVEFKALEIRRLEFPGGFVHHLATLDKHFRGPNPADIQDEPLEYREAEMMNDLGCILQRVLRTVFCFIVDEYFQFDEAVERSLVSMVGSKRRSRHAIAMPLNPQRLYVGVELEHAVQIEGSWTVLVAVVAISTVTWWEVILVIHNDNDFAVHIRYIVNRQQETSRGLHT
jgi:hypothetical protein